jgi:hypothetical protein
VMGRKRHTSYLVCGHLLEANKLNRRAAMSLFHRLDSRGTVRKQTQNRSHLS